ncbi:MAG: CPBP family intramembrane metalloprotease [Oscillospiraceae bacterium]|jgi:membrane protease YdiL (CAAX protease family)|nr:CPBP family intramembrane metalloprotease [Oscillospiraceae bacterium]
MRKKLTSILLALAFPSLLYFFHTAIPTLAFAFTLARTRAQSPGLDGEFLRNQAWLAVRTATPWLIILSAILTLLVVGLIFILLGEKRQRAFTLRRFDLDTKCDRLPLLSLITAALGLGLALRAGLSLLPLPPSWIAEYSDRASSPLTGAGIMAQILCTVVVVPLAEEAVFRGLSFRFLRRGFSLPIAITLQAALFAVFHGSTVQMIYAFPVGIVLGLVYARCGTLAAPIILHMAVNAVSFPLPNAAWGQWLCLLTGIAVTAAGLRGVWAKSIMLRVSPNTSPNPPR